MLADAGAGAAEMARVAVSLLPCGRPRCDPWVSLAVTAICGVGQISPSFSALPHINAWDQHRGTALSHNCAGVKVCLHVYTHVHMYESPKNTFWGTGRYHPFLCRQVACELYAEMRTDGLSPGSPERPILSKSPVRSALLLLPSRYMLCQFHSIYLHS